MFHAKRDDSSKTNVNSPPKEKPRRTVAGRPADGVPTDKIKSSLVKDPSVSKVKSTEVPSRMPKLQMATIVESPETPDNQRRPSPEVSSYKR